MWKIFTDSVKKWLIPVGIALMCVAVGVIVFKRETREAASVDPWADVHSQAWMRHIDGNEYISNINLPGTHNSGARFVTNLFKPFARCQFSSVGDQLRNGIRYLDLRLAHRPSFSEPFHICHGVANCYATEPGFRSDRDSYLYLSHILDSVYSFLKDNPSETVMVCIQEQQTSSSRSPDFENALFDEYIAKAGNNPSTGRPYWYTQNSVPRLDEVRGKVVLLRRYMGHDINSDDGGLDFKGWKDNDSFAIESTNFKAHVQDVYQKWGEEKWKEIASHLKKAGGESIGMDEFVLTFASANDLPLHSPLSIAEDMNLRLKQYAWKQGRRYGWIILDFETRELSRLIFSTNKKAGNPGRLSGHFLP